ncbi:MAG TPA: hypothetical protein VGO79_05805 [Thermoanaerobaculia bacterium]
MPDRTERRPEAAAGGAVATVVAMQADGAVATAAAMQDSPRRRRHLFCVGDS